MAGAEGFGCAASWLSPCREPNFVFLTQVQIKKSSNNQMAGAEGFEPSTLGFGDRCSTAELYP